MTKGRRILVASLFGAVGVVIALAMARSHRPSATLTASQDAAPATGASRPADRATTSSVGRGLTTQPASVVPSAAPAVAGLQTQSPRSFPPQGQAPPVPDGVDGFPDTPAGRAVSQYLLAMSGVGTHAEAEYQASLSNLRRFPKEAVRMVSDVYKSAPSSAYTVKQSAAEALAALKSHEAAEPLAEIAKEPVPAADPGSHENDRQLSEGTLRYTAIRGLGDLAGLGDRAALASLKDLATTGGVTVRLYAAQTYVEAQGYSREARMDVARQLPEGDRLMLEVKPVRANELPQLEPVLQKPLDPAKTGQKPQADDQAQAVPPANHQGLSP